MAPAQKSRATKSAFTGAAQGLLRGRPIRWKWVVGAAIPVVLGLGYWWVLSVTVPPQGSIYFGICRIYIEQQLQFPETMRLIEVNDKVPDGEDPNNPQRINSEIIFSYTDGFGQSIMTELICTFKFDQQLVGTPWNGLFLERVLIDNNLKHGWADVYYKPNQKNPRRADDNNERLEFFFNGIPSLLASHPDLSKPWRNIKHLSIGELQDL
jgi:hypothetical protein